MLGLDKPDQDTIRQIVISTLAWSTVFVLLNAVLLRQRSLGFNNRAVSLLHALVALVLCPAALHWHHPFSGYGMKTTDYQVRGQLPLWSLGSTASFKRCSCVQRFVMNISLGYFTYDMLCCLYIDWDFANVAHHLCTMLGLAVGVCNGVVRLSSACLPYLSGTHLPTPVVCRAERN